MQCVWLKVVVWAHPAARFLDDDILRFKNVPSLPSSRLRRFRWCGLKKRGWDMIFWNTFLKRRREKEQQHGFLELPYYVFLWRDVSISIMCQLKGCTQALSFLIKIVRYGGGEGLRWIQVVCFTAKLAFVTHPSLSLSVTPTLVPAFSTTISNQLLFIHFW